MSDLSLQKRSKADIDQAGLTHRDVSALLLESSFPGQFKSFLCCISETQLDKKTASVKQICVPGTIKLFQRFLSPIEGLYYCDIPARYSLPSLTRYVPVKKLGEVFNDLRTLLS